MLASKILPGRDCHLLTEGLKVTTKKTVMKEKILLNIYEAVLYHFRSSEHVGQYSQVSRVFPAPVHSEPSAEDAGDSSWSVSHPKAHTLALS